MITCDCCGEKTEYFKRIIPLSMAGRMNMAAVMQQETCVLCWNCYQNCVQAANRRLESYLETAIREKEEIN